MIPRMKVGVVRVRSSGRRDYIDSLELNFVGLRCGVCNKCLAAGFDKLNLVTDDRCLLSLSEQVV